MLTYLKRSTQVEYNYNTTAIQGFSPCVAVVLHLCGPLQYNAAIQVFYNLQKTCRLLAAVVKTCKKLYCACVDCCNTTKCLCYFIVVVLQLYCTCVDHFSTFLTAFAIRMGEETCPELK